MVQWILRLQNWLRLESYKKMFHTLREKTGSLSATEAFSADVIHLLGRPTLGQFAATLGISQPNATYKVNSLIKKGYLERQNSQLDRREYHLILSEKYYNYIGLLSSYESTVTQRMIDRFPPEDIAKFDEMLRIISQELMPECGD